MYREYPPTAECSSFLDSIWLSANTTEANTILPDNCSDIVIPLNSSEPIKFFGHVTSYVVHYPEPNEVLLGLRFKPGYSIAFVQEEMSQLTDKVIELSAIRKHSFDKIKAEYMKHEIIPFKTLSKILLPFFDGFKQDADISNSIALIKNTSGNIKIESLSDAVGISRRTLEKKFNRNLGKTPKRFAQIERFNTIIKNQDSLKTMNYYDLSHMTKEFKMLSGKRPSDFFV